MYKILIVEDDETIARPVSYTHLDVYKRQDRRGRIRLHCAFARFAVFFLCAVSKSEDYHKIRNNPGTDGDGKKQ